MKGRIQAIASIDLNEAHRDYRGQCRPGWVSQSTPQCVPKNARHFQQAGAVLKRHQQLAQNGPFAVGDEPRRARQQGER
jgi:hypothetical protein